MRAQASRTSTTRRTAVRTRKLPLESEQPSRSWRNETLDSTHFNDEVESPFVDRDGVVLPGHCPAQFQSFAKDGVTARAQILNSSVNLDIRRDSDAFERRAIGKR
jgi:hypothetical protein